MPNPARILIAGDCNEENLRASLHYFHCVRAVGALPVAACAQTEADAQALADAFDALILTGGMDIDPARFGEAPHPSVTLDHPSRDVSDALLFEAFHAQRKRILGVCRGCQAINVFLGGDLHQHLPVAFDPVLWHGRDITGRHSAYILPDTTVAGILGAGSTSINSSHHQAIRRPAPGLRVSVQAPDGVIEAAEPIDPAANLLLIQWHPEWMGAEMLPIFQWLLE